MTAHHRSFGLALALGLSACEPAAQHAPAPDAGDVLDASDPNDPPITREDTGVPRADRDGGPFDEAYAFPCLGQRDPTAAATFEAVYTEVFCHNGCVDPYCHGSRGTWGGLDLSSIPVAYESLVGAHAGTALPVDGRPTCRESELLRVSPGNPEASLLYLKLTDTAQCGTRMPAPSTGRTLIPAEQADQIRRWILTGAPLSDPWGSL